MGVGLWLHACPTMIQGLEPAEISLISKIVSRSTSNFWKEAQGSLEKKGFLSLAVLVLVEAHLLATCRDMHEV